VLIVVGDREEYDTTARLAFDRGARPGSLIPIWWSGTADALPADLLERAQAVVIQSGRLGDDARATQILEPQARRGARVVFDAGSSSDASLSAFWPVEGYMREPIGAWRLAADTAVVRVSDFAEASYEGGPWSAPIGTSLRPDARAIVTQEGRPLVAQRPIGTGTVLWIGGNLFYHAKSKASDAETTFLMGLLGSATAARPATSDMHWIDPERVDVRSSQASGVFVSESFHPKWTARWSDRSTLGVYYAGPGLLYVPTPNGDGVMTLEFQHSLSDYLVWLPPLAGLVVLLRPWRARRR